MIRYTDPITSHGLKFKIPDPTKNCQASSYVPKTVLSSRAIRANSHEGAETHGSFRQLSSSRTRSPTPEARTQILALP